MAAPPHSGAVWTDEDVQESLLSVNDSVDGSDEEDMVGLDERDAQRCDPAASQVHINTYTYTHTHREGDREGRRESECQNLTGANLRRASSSCRVSRKRRSRLAQHVGAAVYW